jgi:hypothetical protein
MGLENRGTNQNTFEKGNFGNNVSLDIDLARHGKKGSFNASRIENFEETKEKAMHQDLRGYDIVAVRTTPLERAVHTGLAMKEGFGQNETLPQDSVNVRVRELPTGILSVDGVEIDEIMKQSDSSKDLNLISPRIREQYKKAVQGKEGSSWDKENAGVQAFIDLMEANVALLRPVVAELTQGKELSDEAKSTLEQFKNEQKEAGGMSMLEVVLRMSKHLGNYTEVTNRLKNDTKGYIHEVNHSGFIEPMLVYLIKDKIEADPLKAESMTTLEKMGGGFEPNEKVNIHITREKKNDTPILTFTLRGKTYHLDANRLSESTKLLDLIAYE